jgi:glycosyltransferase involved in cell wall biosynthesis
VASDSVRAGHFVSIVIPAFNVQETLGLCLASVFKSEYPRFECIVVDDHSADRTAEIAGSFDTRIIRLDQRKGAAYARNRGAENARGDILFFLDADVVVPADCLSRVVKTFDDNPDIVALFGSYDVEPGCSDFLSQYRNLMHHFVHQSSSPEASTFWSACGAVLRDAFFRVGKYNEKTRMMEDIELGYRLKSKGYRIRLCKDIRVRHFKHYSLTKLLRSDLFDRAVPWTELMWRYGQFTQDLNLQRRHKLSALILVLLFVSVVLSFQSVWFVPAVPILLSAYVLLNIEFYRFFYHQRGLLFTLKVIPLHIIYYFYSSLGFLIGSAKYLLAKGSKGGGAKSDEETTGEPS